MNNRNVLWQKDHGTSYLLCLWDTQDPADSYRRAVEYVDEEEENLKRYEVEVLKELERIKDSYIEMDKYRIKAKKERVNNYEI